MGARPPRRRSTCGGSPPPAVRSRAGGTGCDEGSRSTRPARHGVAPVAVSWPWSVLIAPNLPVRRPWSAVTRSGAPQAPTGGGGGPPGPPRPTPWRPAPRSERAESHWETAAAGRGPDGPNRQSSDHAHASPRRRRRGARPRRGARSRPAAVRGQVGRPPRRRGPGRTTPRRPTLRATGDVAPLALGRAGNACGHHRAPPRRSVVGQGCRPAHRRRTPHAHRRDVDATRRPADPRRPRTRRPTGSRMTPGGRFAPVPG